MKFIIPIINPKSLWVCGSEPGEESQEYISLFRYEISGIDPQNRDFKYSGYVRAFDSEHARAIIEEPRKRSGYKRLWTHIYAG